MLIFEIVFGAVLCVGAVFCLIGAVEEEAGLLFVVPVLGVCGGFLLSAGIDRDWSHGRAAHAALLRAAVAEGYPVRSEDVHSGYGARIDVRAGRCLFSLDATKVAGRWRFGVPESGTASSGGTVFLSPADAAKFREVCPS